MKKDAVACEGDLQVAITTHVNGQPVACSVKARQHLADFVRNDLGLTGTHLGCEHGVCGSCSIELDGAVVRGCLVLAAQAHRSTVNTIEGLSESGALKALQREFGARNAAQCGFCTSGMLLTANELVSRGGVVGRDEIRHYISGNFCRCTGYESIVDAIEAVMHDRSLAGGRFAMKRDNLPIASSQMAIDAVLDKNESLVGRRLGRVGIARLLHGRGRYVGDITLPRMLHLCFVRSPYAHARIEAFDLDAAERSPGVARIFTGSDLAVITKPFIAVAANRKGHKSAPQYPMAVDEVFWNGQPVCAVVARSREEAEDAADLIGIDWQELPAIMDAESALAPDALPIHACLGTNLAFEFTTATGDVDTAFRDAATTVAHRFRFERQTGVSLEPRGLIAAFDPSEGALTVYHSHQSPSQMQDVFSRHLGIPEHKVQVIAPDIGGGFGLKINAYAEELAVAAVGVLLGVPVRYLADRIESFLSDAHVREHTIDASVAVSADGLITGMRFDDIGAIGAYGMPLRFNVAEGMMAVNMAGAPYQFSNYAARTRSAYVNKNLIGMYRGVGMPLACAVTETLMDLAAFEAGVDPVEFKRRNFRKAETLPCVAVGGAKLDSVSFHACLDKLVHNMDYGALRREQAALRELGIYRGIGVATFVEQTAYGPAYYGPTDARISVQDACVLKLEPSGVVRCLTSTTDQGQGTLTGIAQIIATGLGVALSDIDIVSGDSRVTPYGGGAWGSRGMAVGGEAALNAALALRGQLLTLASVVTGVPVDRLDIVHGHVIELATGAECISVAELARIGYFRQDTLPVDFKVQMEVGASHVANHQHYYMANGAQASYIEVDIETGFIKLLGHWAVDDCGRVVNPLLVDEQVRGGVVQGIGAALFEECIYGEGGNLENGSMADYLVPLAADMPDIHVDHVDGRETTTRLGAKGIGEAGTIGAIGALWVAVNDALKPHDTRLMQQPFTPERVLDALRASGALDSSEATTKDSR